MQSIQTIATHLSGIALSMHSMRTMFHFLTCRTFSRLPQLIAPLKNQYPIMIINVTKSLVHPPNRFAIKLPTALITVIIVIFRCCDFLHPLPSFFYNCIANNHISQRFNFSYNRIRRYDNGIRSIFKISGNCLDAYTVQIR